MAEESAHLIEKSYLLLGLQERGGMADVYMGRQLNQGRNVCIKLLKREFASSQYHINLFTREAAVALTHDNLVTVHASGFDHHYGHYIVMEWIEHPTILKALKHKGRFTPEQTLTVARDIVAGLRHLWNQRALIHRDIKPSNVFLCAGNAKVADFGISKSAYDPATQSVSGTIPYMSFEQLNGEPPDPRDDFFSLGCLMYEMVSGKRFFENDLSLDQAKINRDKPHVLNIQNQDKTLDLNFIKLLEGLLQRHRESRFETHDALLTEIERVLRLHQDQGPKVDWFLHRDHATHDMLANIRSYSHLYFCGIVQLELPGLLEEILESSVPSLPWKSITVIFAESTIGLAWRKDKFADELRKQRQLIASVLTNPRYTGKLKALERVEFRQCKQPVSLTGSYFHNGDENEGVICVVLGIPYAAADSKKAVTFKIHGGREAPADSRHSQFFTHFRGICNLISSVKLSENIGAFRRSCWDDSIDTWDYYCNNSKAYKHSVEELLSEISVRKHDKILNVGCATGYLEHALLTRHAKHFTITSLDSSPQMIAHVREKLSSRFGDRARYALYSVPKSDPDRSDVDIRNIDQHGDPFLFNKIIFHLSLPAIDRRLDHLESLAVWCTRRLERNGEVIISARNTTIECAKPKDWEPWVDHFRSDYIERVKAFGGARFIHADADDLLPKKGDPISEHFRPLGFQLTCEPRVLNWALTTEERIWMWSCPGILNTIVDVDSMGIEVARKLAGESLLSIQQHRTMPMVVQYWHLKRRP